jgi:hypothetical protein
MRAEGVARYGKGKLFERKSSSCDFLILLDKISKSDGRKAKRRNQASEATSPIDFSVFTSTSR